MTGASESMARTEIQSVFFFKYQNMQDDLNPYVCSRMGKRPEAQGQKMSEQAGVRTATLHVLLRLSIVSVLITKIREFKDSC